MRGQQRRDRDGERGRAQHDEWRRGQNHARVPRAQRLLPHQLSQISKWLIDRRADAPFRAGSYLREYPNEQRPAKDHEDDLQDRRHDRVVEGWGDVRHANTTSTMRSATKPNAR